MTQEALKLALEALESCTPLDTSSSHVIYPWYDEKLVDKAITALKEALAQPEQEQEPDLSEQGRNRSAVLGNNIEVLMDAGLPFLKALDTTLKAYYHLATPQHRTEQNFCSRCGKRTPDLTHIHTCTPPKENT